LLLFQLNYFHDSTIDDLVAPTQLSMESITLALKSLRS